MQGMGCAALRHGGSRLGRGQGLHGFNVWDALKSAGFRRTYRPAPWADSERIKSPVSHKGTVLPANPQFGENFLLPPPHLRLHRPLIQMVISKKVEYGMHHQIRQLPAGGMPVPFACAATCSMEITISPRGTSPVPGSASSVSGSSPGRGQRRGNSARPWSCPPAASPGSGGESPRHL